MSPDVLITAGSRRVALVNAFRAALADHGGGRVIVTDVNPLSPAVHLADRAYRVPLSSDAGDPSTSPSTDPSPGELRADDLVTGLTSPWGLAFLPGGDALVSERDTALIKRVGNHRLELVLCPGARCGEGLGQAKRWPILLAVEQIAKLVLQRVVPDSLFFADKNDRTGR